jgi:hypothetical protein
MLTSRSEAETISQQEGQTSQPSSNPAPAANSNKKEQEPELPEIDVDSINVQMPF